MPKILEPGGRLAKVVRAAESAEILKALAENGGNVPAAAKALGISVRSLYWRVERYGLASAAGIQVPSR